LTACGSSNSNNGVAGIGGIAGINGALSGAITSGSGQCAPLGPTVAFQGYGYMDSANIYAGGNYGQLQIQTASGSPTGSYPFGRIGADGMIGLTTASSGIGQTQISGFFQFNQTAWTVLTSELGGYSYGGSIGFSGMGAYPGSVPGLPGYSGSNGMCLTAMAINLGYAPNYSGQYGPFQEVLYGGNITMMLTTAQGQQVPATIPF
jgi:hypothetical protein